MSFGPIYSRFGPFFSELEPFLALKVSFFGHFYKGLYIRQVQFWDIPGRTSSSDKTADSNVSLLKMTQKIWLTPSSYRLNQTSLFYIRVITIQM